MKIKSKHKKNKKKPLSDTLFTSTSSPQGCVLSPLLYILHTDNCRSIHPDCHLVKFANDTVLLSFLSGQGQHHGSALQDFVGWCGGYCLELNADKTKEKIVTFSLRDNNLRPSPPSSRGSQSRSMSTWGTIFDNTLRFSSNTGGFFFWFFLKRAITDSTCLEIK